jgi:hypothetical protein
MVDHPRVLNMNLTIEIDDPDHDPLELLKKVYPEAVELADILRSYLFDVHGKWQGHKLWMAVDIAQGMFGKQNLEETDDRQVFEV